MDSGLLHIAYSKAFASVTWDRHGEHDYVLVGDGLAIEHSRYKNSLTARSQPTPFG
jgi:hypothetical protein